MTVVTFHRSRAGRALLCTLSLIATAVQTPVTAAEDFPPYPDSRVQPGVPKGELIKLEFSDSKVFPGTTREVTVYVPRQYDPAKPACVYVNQDGVQWNAPVVFDNLIARGELPVMVGVFVRPGVVKPDNNGSSLDRFNRSYEYDGLGDNYARFLLDELLPFVETKGTTDGRAIRLSNRRRISRACKISPLSRHPNDFPCAILHRSLRPVVVSV